MKFRFFSIIVFSAIVISTIYADKSKMSVVGNAQKISTDIVKRRDANGHYCAAVKIISNLTDLAYQSNNGIVGDIERKPGVDMVFLSTSERVLEIYHLDHEPLQIILSELGIKLHEKEVWQIEISGESKSDIVPVIITTNQKDVEVFIDGKSVGMTDNKMLTINSSAGRHTIQFQKSGYETQKIEKEITLNNNSINVTMQEIELIAVQFKTIPSQANIIINNSEKGVSDCGIWLYPGKYALKVTKSEYLDIEEEIIVKSTGANIFSYSLQKNAGVLTIAKFPFDATVKIDGIEITQKSIELLPGKHKLEVTKSNYLPYESEIIIEAGQKVEKSIVLDMNLGYFICSIEPKDAKLLINKVDYTGKEKIELAPGQYKIEISKEGYTSRSDVVMIERGKDINREYNLEGFSGNLMLNITPISANVKLLQNGDIYESWTGIKSLKDIPIGNYDLLCELPGYKTVSKVISIERDKITNLEITLVDEDSKESIVKNVDAPIQLEYGTVSDVDGNVYKTVKIGNQWWMAENLKATHFQNGDEIPYVFKDKEWKKATMPALCAYDNKKEEINKYGLLYNWYTTEDKRNIAPEGWHVATRADWDLLEINSNENKVEKLKYFANKLIDEKNENDVLNDGRIQRKEDGYFSFASDCEYWTSSVFDNEKAILSKIIWHNNTFTTEDEKKNEGKAIRCVKNNDYKTNEKYNPEIVTDIDGNQYKTIKFGNQIWMVGNLKVTHYQTGDNIPNITKDKVWADTKDGAYCAFNNNEGIAKQYGNLYNLNAVHDNRIIAPKGWRVANYEDWQQLNNYLNDNISDKERFITQFLYEANKPVTNKNYTLRGRSGGYGEFYTHPNLRFWAYDNYVYILPKEIIFQQYSSSSPAGYPVRCIKEENSKYNEDVWKKFESGSVTDIDGNTYRTVKIGDQWWTVDNLKVEHYRNGDEIPYLEKDKDWIKTKTGALCALDNNRNTVEYFGYLYNWYAAGDKRNIAPEGWHVATKWDYEKLEKYLGVDAGEKLKSFSHWGTARKTDENFGFYALPLGHRNQHGKYSRMIRAFFWTGDDQWENTADRVYIGDKLNINLYHSVEGYSIRCVKDAE